MSVFNQYQNTDTNTMNRVVKKMVPWYPWYLGRFQKCRKIRKIYTLRFKNMVQNQQL